LKDAVTKLRLSVPSQLLDDAHAFGVNLSHAAEAGLMDAIRKAKAQAEQQR